jgi:hypothetical protein
MRPFAQLFNRFSGWMKNLIVQPVADEDALREFDCRNDHCTFGHWQTCERRLKRAADELMPKETDTQKPSDR